MLNPVLYSPPPLVSRKLIKLALALGYLANERLEGASDVLPRLSTVVRERRVLVALLIERACDEVERGVAAQQVEVARELRVEFRHVEEKGARVDVTRAGSRAKW